LRVGGKAKAHQADVDHSPSMVKLDIKMATNTELGDVLCIQSEAFGHNDLASNQREFVVLKHRTLFLPKMLLPGWFKN
jgi:hypothetical protein